MGKPRPEGKCHLCGRTGELTFEHVPPQKAFNDQPVITMTLGESLEAGPFNRPRGRLQHRGAGAYTLCGQCNNTTGSWYGSEFARFCYQAAIVLNRSGLAPSLYYPYHCHPLRIIKQVATMAFSVNLPDFHCRHPDLVRFVLNREQPYLPPEYRFFLYYNFEGTFRRVGEDMAFLRLWEGKWRKITEMSFPPLGFVLVCDDEPPDLRLCEITHFSRYRYDDFVTVPLKLNVLPTFIDIAADYRTREEIEEQSRQSQLLEEAS